MDTTTIEDYIMAHRYLYYVESSPIIDDYVYDMLEESAKAVLPENSKVFMIGSDIAEDYSETQKVIANLMLNRHRQSKF